MGIFIIKRKGLKVKELLKAKSEFRKKGVVLVADKQKAGAGGSWKFAGEDNFIKTIQKPLSECGLEYVATLETFPELNINMVVGTLYHIESGESIKSSKILESPEPRVSQSGNKLYLEAEIESGKQFGYWARTLGIRLLGMSDVDPEDMNNRPDDISDEAAKNREELQKIVDSSTDKEKTMAWLKKTFNVTEIKSMTAIQVQQALNVAKQKKKS